MGEESSSDNNANNVNQIDYSNPNEARSADQRRSDAYSQLDRGDNRNYSTGDMLFNPTVGLDKTVGQFNRNNLRSKLDEGAMPQFDQNGNFRGVFSKGLFGGRVYSGTPIKGRPETGWNAGGGASGQSSYARRRGIDPLQVARDRRATAYANRNQALVDAFGGFNDDYYSDLETAFRDVNTPSVQSQYDDAMRGIYQGFKQQGIFDQSDFDSRVAALNAQRTAEEARIGTAAKDYAEQQRQAIADQQSKLAKSLSGIMGGASTVKEIDAQTNNIGKFNFDSDIAKLKAAGPDAPSMDMFVDFDKVSAPTVTGTAPENVAPISPSAFAGGSQLVNTGAAQSGASTGVASPFSGSSVKVL
jgi:hypothetical protein